MEFQEPVHEKHKNTLLPYIHFKKDKYNKQN